MLPDATASAAQGQQFLALSTGSVEQGDTVALSGVLVSAAVSNLLRGPTADIQLLRSFRC